MKETVFQNMQRIIHESVKLSQASSETNTHQKCIMESKNPRTSRTLALAVHRAVVEIRSSDSADWDGLVEIADRDPQALEKKLLAQDKLIQEAEQMYEDKYNNIREETPEEFLADCILHVLLSHLYYKGQKFLASFEEASTEISVKDAAGNTWHLLKDDSTEGQLLAVNSKTQAEKVISYNVEALLQFLRELSEINEAQDTDSPIQKLNGKYVVYNKDKSKILGTHDTYKEALAQLKAIEVNMHKGN